VPDGVVVDEIPRQSRWVGRVLREKWRIDARLARGGVGTVFAATHKNNGNRVAIKVLHTELSRAHDTLSRFLREGYAANQVSHPGVVRILDDDVTDEGLAFLVMELLEGELVEARRLRKGGKLPLTEVYEIADQVLDVLAAAHERGIVHRDIKPDNLFLTREGRLKVLDFGFAQVKTGVRAERTATGFLLGTPGFMPPEQAVGDQDQVDAQTDVWAVGATLFTLLSGKPVHEGESAASALVAAANCPVRSLRTVEPSLPPELVSVVDRALSFDKQGRWPSAWAMQVALRSVPGRHTRTFDPGRSSIPDLAPLAEGSDEDLTLTTIDEEPHPADADEPTLERISDKVVDDGPPDEGGTLIMDHRGGALPEPVRIKEKPGPSEGLGPSYVVTPQAFRAPPGPRPSAPDGRNAAVKSPRRASAIQTGRSLLVFVAVAAISMAIVVVTGLLVLAATD
jgi:eukaryotic-like serine/threonine-protein kinase